MVPLKRTLKNSVAYIFTLSLSQIIFPSHRYVLPLMKNKTTESKQKILKLMYFSKTHSIFRFHSFQLNIYKKESIPAAFILKSFISFVTHWTLSGVPYFTTCYLQLVLNPMISIFIGTDEDLHILKTSSPWLMVFLFPGPSFLCACHLNLGVSWGSVHRPLCFPFSMVSHVMSAPC